VRKLESGALSGLPGILGLGGGGAGEQWVDIDKLQIVLDVLPHIRRKRSNLSTTGIFVTAIGNTHSGAAANVVTATLTPYASPSGVGPWPGNPVPETHDIWLIGCQAQCTAVTGNLLAAHFALGFPTGSGLNVALTPSGAGSAAVTGALTTTVRAFTQEVSLGSLGTHLAEPDGEEINRMVLPFRIGRGCQLHWNTETAALGASVYQLRLILGVFPAGFGQDVIG